MYMLQFHFKICGIVDTIPVVKGFFQNGGWVCGGGVVDLH